MQRRILSASITLLLSLNSAFIYAQDLSKCDLDKNGVISEVEKQQCTATTGSGSTGTGTTTTADPCDTNKDGIIDAVEKQQCTATTGSGSTGTGTTTTADPCDINKDGIIDAVEKQQCAATTGSGSTGTGTTSGTGTTTTADPCDTNKDGIIDAVEKQQCAATTGSGSTGTGTTSGSGTTTTADPCDTNKDGIIDAVEKQQCAATTGSGSTGTGTTTTADPCDTNKDGIIDAVEKQQCAATTGSGSTGTGTTSGTGTTTTADPCDTNKDGIIDAVEKQQCAATTGSGSTGTGTTSGTGTTTTADPCDTNKDGIIDAVEKQQCAATTGSGSTGTGTTSGSGTTTTADPCDTNKDGIIDAVEKQQCAATTGSGSTSGSTGTTTTSTSTSNGLAPISDLDKLTNEVLVTLLPNEEIVGGTKNFIDEGKELTEQEWKAITAEDLQKLRADQAEKIPTDAMSDWTAEQATALPPDVFGKMEAEKILAMDTEVFNSLETKQIENMDFDVWQKCDKERFAALKTETLSALPDDDKMEVLTNVDTNAIPLEELTDFLPEGWEIDKTTYDIIIPPETTVKLRGLKAREMDGISLAASVDLNSDLTIGGKTGKDGKNLLQEINAILEAAGYTVEQDEFGTLKVTLASDSSVLFSFRPQSSAIRTAPAGATAGVTETTGGFLVVTTTSGLEIKLVPTMVNPESVVNTLKKVGNTTVASVTQEDSGVVKLSYTEVSNDTATPSTASTTSADISTDSSVAVARSRAARVQEDRPTDFYVVFGPDTETYPELDPGLYRNRGRSSSLLQKQTLVYDNTQAQRIYATVPEPDTFIKLVKEIEGVTDVVYNADGTFSLTLAVPPLNIPFYLTVYPQLSVEVIDLAATETVAPRIIINEKGLFYRVQVKQQVVIVTLKVS